MLRATSPRRTRDSLPVRESLSGGHDNRRFQTQKVVSYVCLLAGILVFLYADVDVMNAARSSARSKLALSQITTLKESSSVMDTFRYFSSQWSAPTTEQTRPVSFSFDSPVESRQCRPLSEQVSIISLSSQSGRV